ncbi:hypothetical protein DTO282E5_4644 [Paecilomyces variotii]|nr:hypothetical protein DTO282E5_4644 [Paecilomyces variotii]
MASRPFPYAGYSEDVDKRVRVLFNGKFVVDAKKAKLVWEHAYYPTYYFQKLDVRLEYLKNEKPGATDSERVYDLVVDDRVAENAVTVFHAGPFQDSVKVIFSKADAWFEEDERIYVHPKDPYKRIDILETSKHIRVEIEGIEVANTVKARLLYETGLPTRAYIPMTDIRLDLVTPSQLTTSCPYKGDANYFDVEHPTKKIKNLLWWYKNPTLESVDIRGRVAFYNEKVDMWIDGVKQERPVSHFT